jgi:hypothetical protein
VKSEIANQPSSGGGFQPVWQKKIGRELLSRIGLSEDTPAGLFDEDALDELEGDLGAVLRERFEAAPISVIRSAWCWA